MGVLDVLVLSLLVMPAVFGLGFWRGRRRQHAIENEGEVAVRRALTYEFPGPAYHLMNHLTLPFDDGTTQIDHVLVARCGIFVIEARPITMP